MPLIPCALVYHTGTMIRFQPAQLLKLPPSDEDVEVQLPNGHVVSGHFRRNVANPNVSGREIVAYIKRRLAFGAVERCLIDVSPLIWRVYPLEEALPVAHDARAAAGGMRRGRLSANDVARLLEWADRNRHSAQRRQAYERILRPAVLRRMLLDFMAHSCQVEGCRATEELIALWGDPAVAVSILEVHHVEAMARCVDHHPRNLCVICANHHRLVHGFGPWAVEHEHDTVVLHHVAGTLRIVRDLSFLA